MTKKYEHLTKEIAYPMIARFLKSGILPSEFYNKEGLSENQFYTWRKRYLKDYPSALGQSISGAKESRETQSGFHPIHVSVPKHPEPPGRIELEYPNGVVLRVEGTFSETRLASLIKLY